MQSSEFSSVTCISVSVAKCLSISSGARTGKRSHLAARGADGGEWERSHPLHQTGGSSHRHSHCRIAAFWGQGVLVCFLGLGFLTDPGPNICFRAWATFFSCWVSQSALRWKATGVIAFRFHCRWPERGLAWNQDFEKDLLIALLPRGDLSQTHLPSHNKPVCPLSGLPLKTYSPISNFFELKWTLTLRNSWQMQR